MWRLCRLESARNLARKPDFRPGSTIAKHTIVNSKWEFAGPPLGVSWHGPFAGDKEGARGGKALDGTPPPVSRVFEVSGKNDLKGCPRV